MVHSLPIPFAHLLIVAVLRFQMTCAQPVNEPSDDSRLIAHSFHHSRYVIPSILQDFEADCSGRPRGNFQNQYSRASRLPIFESTVNSETFSRHVNIYGNKALTELNALLLIGLPRHEDLMNLIDRCSDGVCICDPRTNQAYYSHRWQATLGYNGSTMSTVSEWTTRIHAESSSDVLRNLESFQNGSTDTDFDSEHQIQHSDGSYRWVRIRGSKGVLGSMFIMTDITGCKDRQERLIRDAYYDELTQLQNVRSMEDHFQQIAQAKRKQDEKFAVLFLDLNDFKPINDDHGHKAGDIVLKECAKRIKEVVRPEDSVFRKGGDEFVVVLKEVTADEEVETVIRRLKDYLSEVIEVSNDVHVKTSVSVGFCISGEMELTPHEMLEIADDSMYDDKKLKAQPIKFVDSVHRELNHCVELRSV